MIKKEACKNIHDAYKWAFKHGPCDETRTVVYKDSLYAYCYAKDVDKGPCAETRTAACKDSFYAYCYAKDIDKGSRDETRTAACQDPWYAYMYARDVDKGPCDETRTGACQDPWHAYCYARSVDKGPCEETWKAVKGSDYEQVYIGVIGMPNSTSQIKQGEVKQDPHEGMIQKYNGSWGWL